MPDPDLIAARFHRFADRTFLVDPEAGEKLTYAEAFAQARSLARVFSERGVAPGDRVGLTLPNGVELALLYFACALRGAVAVPLNPDMGKADHAYCLSAARCSLLIASGTGPAASAGPTVPVWTPAPEDRRGAPLDGFFKNPEDLFCIAFTSGTTARPKGVGHRLSAMLACAEAFNEATGFDADARMAHVMPMTYMAGILNTLLCPFAAGASAAILRAFDAASSLRFWSAIEAADADALWLSPTMLSLLLRLSRSDSGRLWCQRRLRRIFVGTAPLPGRVRVEFENRYGTRLVESYGLSELLYLSVQREHASDTVGLPLRGVEVKTIEDGELLARTPYAMVGYIDPETGDPGPVEPDSWFPTGDLAVVRPDGRVEITGRKKDLIIKGGVNISPRAVEEVLRLDAAVIEAAVVGVPDPILGEEVAAAIVAAPGIEEDELRRRLIELARSRLPKSAVPRRWSFIPELPKSLTGKVAKNKLREMLA